jgi:hypothetical protein
MKKQIIILKKDGSVHVRAEGFQGPECKEKRKFIDKLLGNPETEELKQEFYLAEDQICQSLPEGHCG